MIIDKFLYKINRYCYHHSNSITRTINKIFFNLHIDPNVKIPKSTTFAHLGTGCVIGEGVEIGENVIIHQNTTIGSKNGKSPIIQDNVTIYPNCVIVGGIIIGKGAMIGALTFVDKNIYNEEVYYRNYY